MIEKNTYIYYLKALAIFSVVCAHCTLIPDGAGTTTTAAANVLDYIGTMGVPIFFIVSGYLFCGSKRGFANFWKRKALTEVLPRIVCESLLYLYVVIRKGGASITGYIVFVLGYKYTTYYLTVLIVFYMAFWKIGEKRLALYSFLSVWALSVISTGAGSGLDIVNRWTGTFYLNPLNWMGFFIIGMLLVRFKKLDTVLEKISHLAWFWLVLSVLYYFVCHHSNVRIFYFSRYALIGHFINILLLAGLAGWLRKYGISFLEKLGEKSYSVYLLHQFISGFIAAITNITGPLLFLLVMRPFIVILLVMCGLIILEMINKRCGRLDIVFKVIGSR